ncbi:MAG TPA: tetratricopeptide repeat protein [Pirellulales bacterium]|nr:tetratricopeptide repeat protein [Pirellulales bacterium]
MFKRFLCLLGIAGLVLLSAAYAVDHSAADAAADGWTGRFVLAKSPAVVLREAPDGNSATIQLSLTGIWLEVQQKEGDWLKFAEGWLPVSDVMGEEGVVEHFTAQLKQGESVFSYLGRARGWLNQNDFGKAEADVSEALRLEPQNARAFFVRGKIAAKRQRNDEALANYDRALDLSPRGAAVLAERGVRLMNLGEDERAIRDFDAAIEVNPADSHSWAMRGWCRSNKREFEKALADLAEAVRRNPRDAYVRAAHAVVYLRNQKLDEALAEAQEALRLNPKLGEGFATRGAVYAFQEKLDEALSDLNEAIRLGVAAASTFSYRAYAHSLKGNLDAAALDYTQAISLKADDAGLYFRRAEVWAGKGDNASAIVDLGECLKLAPQTVEAYVQRGRLRSEPDADGALPGAARLDEALDDFQQALRLDPRHVDALIHRAYIWSAKNETEKAQDDLSAAIRINPHESEAYCQRAGIHTSRGEYGAAIEDLTAGIGAEPTKTACLLDRAVAFALKGEYQKAIDDCQAVLKIEPNNTIAYFHTAMACSWGDRSEEAYEAYSAILRIDPDDAGALESRGHVAARLGKFDMALADFERLRQMKGHEAEAIRARSQVWEYQGQWDKAAADLTEAIRLKPDDAEMLRQRSACWLQLKKFDKAIAGAKETVRLEPNSELALQTLHVAQEAKAGRTVVRPPIMGATTETITINDAVLGNSEAGPLTPLYDLTLQGPAGFQLALEGAQMEEFEDNAAPFPQRVPMFDQGMARFKLAADKELAKDLFGRIESAHLSPEEAARCNKKAPSLQLTKDNLHIARSGTDVIKVLVLAHAGNEPASEPEFEVLTSTATRRLPELLSEAARRGTVIAALDLSEHLPPLTPFLPSQLLPLTPNDRFVRFTLRGPQGLTLAHELPVPGKFDEQPQPVAAHFAFLPGIEMRFQLKGPPIPAGTPLYGWLSVSGPWPTELGPPGKTELLIDPTVRPEAFRCGSAHRSMKPNAGCRSAANQRRTTGCLLSRSVRLAAEDDATAARSRPVSVGS